MKFAQYINENTEDKEFAKLLISKLWEVNSSGELKFTGSEMNRSYSNAVSLALDPNNQYDKFLEDSKKIYMAFLENYPKLKATVMNITGEQSDTMYFAVTNWGIILMDKNGNNMGTIEVDKSFFVKEARKHLKLVEKDIAEFKKQKEKGSKIPIFRPKLGKSLKVFEPKPTWMTDWTSKPRIMTVEEVTQENLDLIKKLSRNKTVKAAEEAVKEFCLAKGFKLAQGETWQEDDVNRYSTGYGRTYDHTISYGVYIKEIPEDDFYTLMHIINIIMNKNDKIKTIQTSKFFGIKEY